jgi:hypothetical protein
VIRFLGHRGYPVPSPACLQQIGDAFRRRVASFAEANHIPVVTLKAADRNIEVMQPYLDKAAATGRSQVAAVGVAQEMQRVLIARQRLTDPGKCPQFSFDKKDRRVTVYYFYLWDVGFGPAFIKVCTYCPWPVKIWVNGHERARQQARKIGFSFTELSNGFAACQDPAMLQKICDALQPGTITVSDNIDAFSELGFAPTVAGKPAKRDLATTVMGQPVSLPVIISPTGVQAVHPDGEVAVARAAAARGTAVGLSSFASKPVEEVVAANPKTFFQAYWVGTREDMLAHMARGRAAGAAGLILTLDWAWLRPRRRGWCRAGRL